MYVSATIGTVQNACVDNRGGLRVEASSSTDDYFRRNLVAIRAEPRLALACYRASGYLEVRFARGSRG